MSHLPAWTGGTSKKNGRCIEHYPNGDIYEGTFVKGLFEDRKGKYISADGTVFRGELRQGFRVGKGVLKADVQGVLEYSNGEKYVGQFARDFPEGHGVKTWPAQGTTKPRRYEGQFSRGAPSGEGTLTVGNGLRYEGNWQRGAQCGHGVCVYPDKKRYEGEWLDGQKHGFGAERMAPPLSTVYQGEWRYGRKEGHGKIITPENEEFEGEWKNDVQISGRMFD